jgi:hypothetical protein
MNGYDSSYNGGQEIFLLMLPDITDSDLDSLADYGELQLGTDPNDNDSDDDQMPDGWEYDNGLNGSKDDANGDADSDDLSNLFEYINGTDPNNNDTDNDGLLDGQEAIYETDPLDNDTDNDLMPDGWEVTNGLNATLNDASSDLDLDGLLNYQEYTLGTRPNNVDSDDDGVKDGREISVFYSDPMDDSDPEWADSLMHSSFFGGSNNDYGRSIAIDTQGSIFVTGETYSSTFPTTGGAYDTTYNSYYDCFVLKLNSAGDTLLYSTFVGGSNYDYPTGIAVATGYAYVSGYTQSSDFPTESAWNSTINGGYDAFVFKLNPSGDDLVYSTYVGGSSTDYARCIAVDPAGNAFVAGETHSYNFPLVNAYQNTSHSAPDCFVFKLGTDGSSMGYSTYVGSSSNDYAYQIILDDDENAYLVGHSYTSDFPMVGNSYDTTFAGNYDCVIFKMNSVGDLTYSSYLGGSSTDYGYGIAVDSSGNIYVSGMTYSSDFPTANAYDSTHNGNYDCFISKISGSDLIY